MIKENKIVAIDAGLDGGIATLTGSKLQLLPMPIIASVTPKDSGKKIDVVMLSEIVYGADEVIIEEQFILKKQGNASNFTIGRNYEALITVCRMLGVKYTIRNNKVWQKFYPFSTQKFATPRLKKKEHIKESNKVIFERGFENDPIKKDGIADALLILNHHLVLAELREKRKDS